jgi:hypothetical protein
MAYTIPELRALLDSIEEASPDKMVYGALFFNPLDSGVDAADLEVELQDCVKRAFDEAA